MEHPNYSLNANKHKLILKDMYVLWQIFQSLLNYVSVVVTSGFFPELISN